MLTIQITVTNSKQNKTKHTHTLSYTHTHTQTTTKNPMRPTPSVTNDEICVSPLNCFDRKWVLTTFRCLVLTRNYQPIPLKLFRSLFQGHFFLWWMTSPRCDLEWPRVALQMTHIPATRWKKRERIGGFLTWLVFLCFLFFSLFLLIFLSQKVSFDQFCWWICHSEKCGFIDFLQFVASASQPLRFVIPQLIG